MGVGVLGALVLEVPKVAPAIILLLPVAVQAVSDRQPSHAYLAILEKATLAPPLLIPILVDKAIPSPALSSAMACVPLTAV